MNDTDPAPLGEQLALATAVRDMERHVARGGWDGPTRIFALIRTHDALTRDPGLRDNLPPDVLTSAEHDPNHITPVEQEDLPDADSVGELLGQLAWGPHVDGAAISTERIVLPPDAERDLPKDHAAATEALLTHPKRQDLRLVAAAMRTGLTSCAIRSRDNDTDDAVGFGPDLIPGLTEALLATFED